MNLENVKAERENLDEYGFRPQQGLTIMNPYLQNPDKH